MDELFFAASLIGFTGGQKLSKVLPRRQLNRHVDSWTDIRTDGQIDGLTDGQLDGQMKRVSEILADKMKYRQTGRQLDSKE